MFSPTQHEDKLLLHEIGETIATLARLNQPDLVEKYYIWYEDLKEKLNSHDYQPLDDLIEKHELWTKNLLPHS